MQALFNTFNIAPSEGPKAKNRIVAVIDYGEETYWKGIGKVASMKDLLDLKPAVFFFLPKRAFAVIKAYRHLDDCDDKPAIFTFEYEVFNCTSLSKLPKKKKAKAMAQKMNLIDPGGTCDVECGPFVQTVVCELGEVGYCDGFQASCRKA